MGKMNELQKSFILNLMLNFNYDLFMKQLEMINKDRAWLDRKMNDTGF